MKRQLIAAGFEAPEPAQMPPAPVPPFYMPGMGEIQARLDNQQRSIAELWRRMEMLAREDMGRIRGMDNRLAEAEASLSHIRALMRGN